MQNRCGYEILNLLPSDFLSEVGKATIFAGTIEIWMERTIWSLKGESISGVTPSTADAPFSRLLNELIKQSDCLSVQKFKKLIKLWSDVAGPAFQCRNSILHGLL